MVMQGIFGVFLEIVHGWKRVAIIYFSSVFGGSLLITALSPEPYSVGASGALFGLIFSHLCAIIINWNEISRKYLRLFLLLAYITFELAVSISSIVANGRLSSVRNFR